MASRQALPGLHRTRRTALCNRRPPAPQRSRLAALAAQSCCEPPTDTILRGDEPDRHRANAIGYVRAILLAGCDVDRGVGRRKLADSVRDNDGYRSRIRIDPLFTSTRDPIASDVLDLADVLARPAYDLEIPERAG